VQRTRKRRRFRNSVDTVCFPSHSHASTSEAAEDGGPLITSMLRVPTCCALPPSLHSPKLGVPLVLRERKEISTDDVAALRSHAVYNECTVLTYTRTNLNVPEYLTHSIVPPLTADRRSCPAVGFFSTSRYSVPNTLRKSTAWAMRPVVKHEHTDYRIEVHTDVLSPACCVLLSLLHPHHRWLPFIHIGAYEIQATYSAIMVSASRFDPKYNTPECTAMNCRVS
jgi:hypothetical protein